MEILQIISPYTIAIAVTWLSAHTIKYIIGITKNDKTSFGKKIFMSGGMPSAHSATIMSLATVIGLRDGMDTGLFGLVILMAMIVMYDAVKVRRSSGEQGDAIAALIKETGSKVKIPYIAKGHLVIEVIAGAAFGIIIGMVVFLATK
jgi:acid phosphatase family membrane protein YuiD